MTYEILRLTDSERQMIRNARIARSMTQQQCGDLAFPTQPTAASRRTSWATVESRSRAVSTRILESCLAVVGLKLVNSRRIVRDRRRAKKRC